MRSSPWARWAILLSSTALLGACVGSPTPSTDPSGVGVTDSSAESPSPETPPAESAVSASGDEPVDEALDPLDERPRPATRAPEDIEPDADLSYEDAAVASIRLDGPPNLPPDPDAETPEDDEAIDPCTPDMPRRDWVDVMRRGVYRGVCSSARWIDGFFGSADSVAEEGGTFGRVGLATYYDEVDGFRVRGKAKIRVNLPRLENRLNAFVGRFDEDDFVADRESSFVGPPKVFRDQTDREWLAGLGYSPVRNAKRRLDIDAGAKLGFPVDLFVRGRYRGYFFPDDVSLVRLQQTGFWRTDKGLGTTSLADYERVLGETFHFRVRAVGTWAEKVDGVDWESGITLYQALSERKALAYNLGIDGETDAPVPIEEYGLQVLYRQSIHREWLFIELRSSLLWKREDDLPQNPREMSMGFGLGFEMYFGRDTWLRP